MKKKWLIILIVAVLLYGYSHHKQQSSVPAAPASISASHSSIAGSHGDQIIANAFSQHQSDVGVEGSGRVIKTLPDDNKGSRHQRFILKLDNGQTVLVAHNIDLAPKLKGLKKGDIVGFHGDYMWSAKGGVIHWTHKDPRGKHVDGWLRYNGQIYQ